MDKELVIKNDDDQLHVFLKAFNAKKLCRPNCKVCQSKFRSDAEEYYELKKHNLSAVKTFLEEKKEDVSYRGVRNHFKRHYMSAMDMEALQEYGSDLTVWGQRRLNIRHNMEERINILTREMIMIAASSSGRTLDERRKSADVVKKLSDGISSIENKMLEQEKMQEPVEIFINQLHSVISRKLETCNNEEVKTALLDVLDDLSTAVADYVVEDK